MPTPTADYDLPNVAMDIADQGLRVSAPVPGVKLTLIGCTDNLLGKSLYEPYLLSSPASAIQALKNADGSDSPLSLSVEKALEAGARNIEVVISAETSDFANENARWDALANTFDALKDHNTDFVVADGAFGDAVGLSGNDSFGDPRDSFIIQMGDFCYRATKVGNTIRGVVGLRPLLDTARLENWSIAPTSDDDALFGFPTLSQILEWKKHIYGETGTLDNHSAETVLSGYIAGSEEQSPGILSTAYDGWAHEQGGDVAVDWKGNDVDGGRAYTVVAFVARQRLSSTPLRAAIAGFGGQDSENTNGAVAYAALLTNLRAGESPTNQTIKSIVQARAVPASFGRDMLNVRIATMVTRTNGFVVNAGMTGAYNASRFTRSDFVNHTSYDTVIRSLDLCKNIIDPYIGRQASPQIVNALDGDLNKALQAILQAGLATKISASLIQTRDQQILGDMDIQLSITPTGEMRNFNIRAALSRE